MVVVRWSKCDLHYSAGFPYWSTRNHLYRCRIEKENNGALCKIIVRFQPHLPISIMLLKTSSKMGGSFNHAFWLTKLLIFTLRPCPCSFLIFAFSAEIFVVLPKFCFFCQKLVIDQIFCSICEKFVRQQFFFAFPAQNWSWDKYFHIFLQKFGHETNTWLWIPIFGHQFLDPNFWAPIFGPQPLDPGLWTLAFGPWPLDLSLWDPSLWTITLPRP